MNDTHHVEELLSGYLDGELTQQENQRIQLHLQECEHCTGLLKDLRELQTRMGASSLGTTAPDWRETTNDALIENSRLLGFVLLCLSGVLFLGYGVYQFFTGDSTDWFEKLIVGGLYAGLVVLLLSVLRQRLLERKKDRYNKVEI